MTVIDIGANVGGVTAVAAECVGAGGRVIAYEPTPALVARLEARFRDQKHVEIRHAAVSDYDGTAAFTVYDERSTASTLYVTAVVPSARRIMVPVCSLDAESATCPPVDFVKIDAQGAEGRIFAAARRLLKRDKPLLIFELWLHGLRAAGSDAATLLDRLGGLGYHFHPLNAKGEAGSDEKIHAFLEGKTRAQVINVLGHPRRWPGHHWRHIVAPTRCVVRRSCRPWITMVTPVNVEPVNAEPM
jgi:FkbM family methyltransferase